jgi:hypothetical protein
MGIKEAPEKGDWLTSPIAYPELLSDIGSIPAVSARTW